MTSKARYDDAKKKLEALFALSRWYARQNNIEQLVITQTKIRNLCQKMLEY